MALSSDGSKLFVGERTTGRIRTVNVATGAVGKLVSGTRTDISEFSPGGMALSADGNSLFLADCNKNRIRRVDVAAGAVSTLAGSGEPGTKDGHGSAALFEHPTSLCLTADGCLLVGGSMHGSGVGRIRKVVVTTRTVSTFSPGCGHIHFRISSDGTTMLVLGKYNIISLITTRSLPPVVVPPSTLAEDFLKTRGDSSLPTGLVTFIVGSEQQRIEHISKTILSARSEYFSLMFRGIMTETAADTITVPDASPAAFESLVDFLLADQITIDTNTGHAFEVMQLARKYQVLRLEVCQCLFPVSTSLSVRVRISEILPYAATLASNAYQRWLLIWAVCTDDLFASDRE